MPTKSVPKTRVHRIARSDDIDDTVQKDRPFPVSVQEDVAMRSAFGELLTVEPTPSVQWKPIYSLNGSIVNTAVTGSGTVAQADRMAVCSTTAATSSSARIETKDFIRYRSGQGVSVMFTGLFTTGVAGSLQFIGAGDAAGLDRLGYGFDGTSFGILHRNNTVDDWIPQAEWNIDPCDDSVELPSIDPTKINVFAAVFQYLGGGAIKMWREHPDTGKLWPTHIFQYANKNIVPSFSNPSFPLMLEAVNTSNNTNIICKTSSMAGFIQGKVILTGPQNSVNNSKNVGTTLTNVLTIRNRPTYQGVANRVIAELISLSFSSDGTKPVVLELFLDTTLGGSPSYTNINTADSIMEFDIAGTTITGGKQVGAVQLAKDDSTRIPVTDIHDTLLPGEALTIAASTSGGTSDVGVSIRWEEDF